MTPENVEAKIEAITKQFDVLTAEKTEKQFRVEEIDKELYRLQGEYRVLTSLLSPEIETASPGEAISDANTIIVPEAEEVTADVPSDTPPQEPIDINEIGKDVKTKKASDDAA